MGLEWRPSFRGKSEIWCDVMGIFLLWLGDLIPARWVCLTRVIRGWVTRDLWHCGNFSYSDVHKYSAFIEPVSGWATCVSCRDWPRPVGGCLSGLDVQQGLGLKDSISALVLHAACFGDIQPLKAPPTRYAGGLSRLDGYFVESSMNMRGSLARCAQRQFVRAGHSRTAGRQPLVRPGNRRFLMSLV